MTEAARKDMVVAVVLVTYNSADVLDDCLTSLLDGAKGVTLRDVLVVDNNSRDHTVALAETAADLGLPIRVVQLGRNAGYAAAINAGIDALRPDPPDAVLILNPDARLRVGSIAALAASLNGRRGITVPRLVFPDGSLQPSLRRKPTVLNALGEAVLGARAGRTKRLGELVVAPEEYEHPGPAVWATGASMLVSWQVSEEVGRWDESFLLYSEETDFTLRAADRGWTCWYEPASVMEHLNGESGTNPMLWALQTVNRVVLFRRRNGFVRGGLYWLAVTAGQAVRALAGRRPARLAVRWLVRPSARITVLPQ
ncbi:glycosyltransferase family 2 protein [Labedaea rhizosphaerae]|uniref:GT2 family glycosyltransferase n=1 Tax=Labedaea rhizosphaerae TaxID=598644 RepID=A0A4R6SNE0_LABRH|nr:glycosyltransferase family 2 protein [Labedaea rhizosphaerae]TDQ05524.1 GT2 family glycosyltransferase [Labedaea rhizosphaerae]